MFKTDKTMSAFKSLVRTNAKTFWNHGISPGPANVGVPAMIRLMGTMDDLKRVEAYAYAVKKNPCLASYLAGAQ